MHDGGTKAVVAALLANIGIAAAKFVGFFFTGAASMLAEAIHSVADSANQGLLLFGARRASRAPTERHQFGFGTERYFWSFVVALVLFTVGGIFALFEGIEKLRHPHALESPQWALGILAVAVVLESLSFRTAIKEASSIKGELGWWGFIRHSRVPELPVVLLEDLGALVGLVLALVGVGLAALTGEARFDAVGSIAIGILLCVIAAILTYEMKSLLIGEGATPNEQRAIEKAIEGHGAVKRLIHIRTRYLGPDEMLLAAKIDLVPSLSFADVCRTIDEIEAAVRKVVPSAKTIYLEPDQYRN
jgi:cation diffusion facilitator family transporter